MGGQGTNSLNDDDFDIESTYWGDAVTVRHFSNLVREDSEDVNCDKWTNRRSKAKPKLASAKRLSDDDFETMKQIAPQEVREMMRHRVRVQSGHHEAYKWLEDNIDDHYYVCGDVIYLADKAALTKFMLVFA